MIKITKNNSSLTVTRGAFENTFKALGYKIVDERKDDKNVKDAVYENVKEDNKNDKKVDNKKSE